MKILFFTTNEADYLQDSTFHGLRFVFGNNVVDYPRKDILYKNCMREDIYGKGFTLYKILEDIPVDRNNIKDKIKKGFFELIIFGSIHRQQELYFEYQSYLSTRNTIILDGEDSGILFPNHRVYKSKPSMLLKRRLYNKLLYYKREITEETNYYRFHKTLSKKITVKISLPSKIHPISFSIPEEKIIGKPLNKTKLFPTHIVDEEIAPRVEGSLTKYAFDNENEYYEDLQTSKFGITTKRSGWDCLRHYEIAANGAVICFRDLDKKPVKCAPHGLIPGVNCISYSSYDDLLGQISNLSDSMYEELQQASIVWIKNNTTVIRAREILTHLK